MIARSLFYLLWCALLSVSLCVIGVLTAYFIQGEAVAIELLRSWVVDFNGILVGATGYGLMLFVRNTGTAILAQLSNVIEIPPEHAPQMLRLQRRLMSWGWANLISIPLAIAGAIVLWNCNFPLQGFAKYYLAICSISIYYVASNILSFFLYTLSLFNYIETQSERGVVARLCTKDAHKLDFNALDQFFVLTSTIGVCAIYFGFRGTLTANFAQTPEIFRDLLILPVLLHLPATICYSFYPRYVLRKVAECDSLMAIEEFERQSKALETSTLKDSLELRKLILEIKEKVIADHRASPLLGFRDAPSLTLAIVVMVQYAVREDTVIRRFFDDLF